MNPTPDDLRTRIREALVLHTTRPDAPAPDVPDVVAAWQREARDAGLPPLAAAALVNEVRRQVSDNRVLLDNIVGRARRLVRKRFNGQLTPDDLVLLSGAAQPLGLSAEFVRDRWMPALFATPDPSLPPSPPVADPPPAPALVPPVNQPIRIEWLVPPGAPEPDLPTLTTQSPTAPSPRPSVAPVIPPNQPVPAPATPPSLPDYQPVTAPMQSAKPGSPPQIPAPPTNKPAPAPSQTTVPPADPYASLVNQEPVRPSRSKTTSGRFKKPFLETTGGIVSLAVLVTVVLIGGILYLNKTPPDTEKKVIIVPPKRKPATIDPQMSYRWDAASGRTLTLGVNASVPPTVKLTGGRVKKKQNADEQSVKLAGVLYRWQVVFSNLPAGIYTVKATIPTTASGKVKTVTEYLKISDLLDSSEGNTAPTKPRPDPVPTAVEEPKPVPEPSPAPPDPTPTKPPKNPYRVQPEPSASYDKLLPERGQYGEQAAQKNGKWGLWLNGKWKIQPIYDDIGLFRNRRAAVHLGGQTFEIDYFGSRIRDEN